MSHRIEHDRKPLRQGHRHRRPLARRQLHHVERHPLDDAFEILRRLGSGTPENLAHVFGVGKQIRIMRGDLANSRVHGEGDLDQLVERRLVIGRAQRAVIIGPIEGLQRGAGFEHAPAPGANHAPGHVEQAEPRRMRQRRDHRLLAQAVRRGEGERIDPVERPVRGQFDLGLERRGDLGVGGSNSANPKARRLQPWRSPQWRLIAVSRPIWGGATGFTRGRPRGCRMTSFRQSCVSPRLASRSKSCSSAISGSKSLSATIVGPSEGAWSGS